MKVELSDLIFKQVIEDTLSSGGVLEHFVLRAMNWAEVKYRIMELDGGGFYPQNDFSKHIVNRVSSARTVETSSNINSLCEYILKNKLGVFARNFVFDQPVSIGSSLHNTFHQGCMYHSYNPLFDKDTMLIDMIKFATSWVFFASTFDPEKVFYSNGVDVSSFKESAKSLFFSIYSGDTYLEVYDLKWLEIK